MSDVTIDDPGDALSRRSGPRPGVIAVYSGHSPFFWRLPLEGGTLHLGRGADGMEGWLLDDGLSRKHAEMTFDAATGMWTIRDLESRNGTYVDGTRVQGEVSMPSPQVVRIGHTLLLPCLDVDAMEPPEVSADGFVLGSRLRPAFEAIARDAAGSETLLVLGETGSGKERAARVFHASGPHAAGPFVAVNCATIQPGLAERLLFGARRGAFSGATADSVGHLQHADGGVLFLDEVAELDLGVQAKLLRVLETREVVPLGASHGKHVDVRICAATHDDLRTAVAQGRFRADLYHRLAPPEVHLPPLRERLDEIAQHVVSEIAACGTSLPAHAKLVEACLLRAWPGNVRELRKAIRYAVSAALGDKAEMVRASYLSPHAGLPFDTSGVHAVAGPTATGPIPALPASPSPEESPAAEVPGEKRTATGKKRGYVKWSQSISREQLERVLEEHAGSVATAARSLGMQRTQMYRQMDRWSIKRPHRNEGGPK